MKHFILFAFVFVLNVFASEPECGTTGSSSVVLSNGNQPLVYVLVDFKDGRKHVGNNYLEITSDADLNPVPNLN